MQNAIIEESIKSLRSEGLRFSVDTLAEKLKISKKTIYKYFPTKEALALAMYEQYYLGASNRAKALLKENGRNIRVNLLRLYFDSKTMIRSEVFNKYKLNSVIRAYADKQNDALWATISAAFGIQTENEGCALRVVVDGTLEKLCDTHTNPDNVLERLVKFL